LIPAPGEQGVRILETRALLLQLKNLIDPGTICRICSIDRDDLDLLARVEAELEENQRTDDGQRHKADH
jgi:hypothetical protein